MARCLNPKCDTEIPVAGVCVGCANSDYAPEEDGLQLSEDTVVKGTKQKAMQLPHPTRRVR